MLTKHAPFYLSREEIVHDSNNFYINVKIVFNYHNFD